MGQSFPSSRPLSRQRGLHIAAIVSVIFFMLPITLAAAVTRQFMRTYTTSEFNLTASQSTDSLALKLDSYINLLYTARAFLLNSDHITRDEWENFFQDKQSFERYPGIHRITYAERISRDQVENLTQAMRAPENYGSNFTIHPFTEKEEYLVITRTSSLTTSTSVPGTDLSSVPNYQPVFNAAKLSRGPQASGPITLINGQSGFIVTLPHYRENGDLAGYVIAVFQTEQFIKAVQQPTASHSTLRIQDVTDEPTPLYTSPTWSDSADSIYTSAITFGQRTWEVSYAENRGLDTRILINILPLLILLLGFTITSLFILIFRPLSRYIPSQ